MTSGPAPLHPADLTEALTAFALGLQKAATHPDGHDGIATDPNQPVLRELAARLHAHALGGVMVTRGVTAPELAQLLGLLAPLDAALDLPLLAAPVTSR